MEVSKKAYTKDGGQFPSELMSTLSVVISARNEEKKIHRCLASVVWADEIILVDNFSTDRTAAIAKKFKTRIIKKPNNRMLNINKNYGIKQADSQWVLYLDADEEIPKPLAAEIRSVINSEVAPDGYWISRKNISFGKWIRHGLWWPDKQLRLFKKGKGQYPCKHVHEKISVDGQVGELTEPFIHYNYETIGQYLMKLELYTDNEVANLEASGYIPVWQDALRFPVSDFLKIFFAQEGYKDGLHGLVLSMLQAFYSFIVFVKLWEYRGYNEQNIQFPQLYHELIQRSRETAYWVYGTGLKGRPFPQNLWWRLKRKLVTLRGTTS